MGRMMGIRIFRIGVFTIVIMGLSIMLAGICSMLGMFQSVSISRSLCSQCRDSCACDPSISSSCSDESVQS